ncbi:hypothetical protein AFLA_005818 [Aspergillus flavus NRRL3357]|nr:hypothetical protein AFLA_005818 [Aspergillus flavus NRRL3357]
MRSHPFCSGVSLNRSPGHRGHRAVRGGSWVRKWLRTTDRYRYGDDIAEQGGTAGRRARPFHRLLISPGRGGSVA